MMRLHPSDVDSASEFQDPPRLAEDLGISASARGLLLSPPPVKPLDTATAARVRAAVLQSPGGLAATNPLKNPSASTVARLKLGAVAGAAALFGAGAMTLASGYSVSSESFGPQGEGHHGVIVTGSEGGGGRSGPTATLGETDERADLRQGPAGLPPSDAWNGSEQKPEGPTDSLERSSLRQGTNLDSHSDDLNQARAAARGSSAATPPAEGGHASVARSSLAHTSPQVLSVNDLQPLKNAPAFGSSSNTRTPATVKVRPEFRKIASASVGPSAQKVNRRSHVGSSLEEETRLLEEARGKLGREPDAALALALTHQTRFRRGQLLEQRRMIHLEALLRLGRDDEALTLAKSIGNSIYQARAQALLAKYGI